ncbi:MAG: hypothetical protein M3044_23445, partial [Thermoproteota archaeon]|nr:hypothetical protein [Thermoproteota archaeon]
MACGPTWGRVNYVDKSRIFPLFVPTDCVNSYETKMLMTTSVNSIPIISSSDLRSHIKHNKKLQIEDPWM